MAWIISLLQIQVAGRTFEQTWQVTPSLQLPLSYDFYWDGNDASGRRIYGAQSVSTRVTYSYLGVYEQTHRFGYAGDGVAISAPTNRFFATMWQDWSGTMENWDAKQSGLGGWDLDVHQGYDPLSGTLHLGTGDEQPVPASLVPLSTITTTWRDTSVGGAPTFPTVNGSGLPLTTGVVVDTDGSVYFVAQGNRIGRITRDKFAPSGDGKVDVVYGAGATTTPPNPTPPNPVLQGPSGLAMGQDHQLYVCDTQNNRIVRIDPITHLGTVIAGNGPDPHSDGPALTSSLSQPYGITVASDGTIYFTEGESTVSGSIRRIRDGQIVTVVPLGNTRYASSIVAAKDGSVYYAVTGQTFNAGVYKIAADGTRAIYAGGVDPQSGYGDGGPATSANLATPNGLALGPDGLLYISDTGHNTIRRVGADGVISTVVGTPGGGAAHDGKGNSPSGLAPLSTLLNTPVGVAFDSDGMLYITDNANQKIRATTNAALVNGSGYIPSADGAHLYLFDANFQHIKTVDAHTGIPEYFFRYSSPGHLTGISNRDLNDPTRLETQIIRDSSGNPMQIVSPFGQTTTLSVVGGQLLSITDPIAGTHGFSYYPGGLIQTLSEPTFPRNVSYAFEFTNGQLSKDTDPLGNSQRLSVGEIPGVPGSQRVTYTDQLARNTYYDIQQPDATTMMSAVTTPDGLSTVKSSRTDGTASYVAPNQVSYSSRQSNPDGSSAYWQTANDDVSGVRSPFVSSRLDFMGSTTDPVRTTSSTRSLVVADPLDLSSVSSFSQTDSVNTRPTVLTYNKLTQTFTTTSPAGRTTTRQVDSFGRTASFQVGRLAPTVFTYDDSAAGTGTGTQQLSLTEQVDPGMSPSSQLDRKTAYTYFPVGSGGASGYLRQIAHSQVGSPGQTTTFTRDAFGRVLTSTAGSDTSTFGWDGNGNLTAVTPPANSEHDQTYTYLNQQLAYLPPATTPPTVVNTSYTYTPDRKLLTETNPDGVVTTRDYYPTSGKPFDITGFASSGGIVSYDYFANGDLAPGHSPGNLRSIGRSGGANLSFGYTGALLSSATWGGVGSVAWTYDNDFAPITETITDAAGATAAVNFGYTDLDHFLTCASLSTCSGTDALSVAHDSNGLLNSVNYGTLTEAYSYNSFGELASKTAKFGTAPLLQSTYDSPNWVVNNRRDALGRISHREETIGTSPTATFDYIYSAEGRLTDVLKGGSPYEHYDYSAKNGNRIAGSTPQRNVLSSQVQYDYPQDRLLKYGPYTYAYTNNGELKTKTDSTTSPASVTNYAYDTLGNLLSVTPTGGQAISFVIDGMNRRVGKLVAGATVKQWLYRDSLKPVAELDGQGHLVSTFVYGSSSNVPDYMVRAGKTYRVLTDQLGSPRVVVNVLDSADVAFRAEYTAFGERTVTVGAADFIPFGFAGGMFDVDTGLVRFGFRDYDPAVGRWTAKDPIRFGGDQLNLYLYVSNDPINKADPTGTDQ